MNAPFFLVATPRLTGFKLRKQGENWEQEFTTIPQAVSYACSIATEQEKIIVLNATGKEVAQMAVDPF
jgi:hypothetical protein